MTTMIDTQNREMMYAYELIANTNSSFFLTGRAGSGKTTFLRNVKKCVDKNFITLAPTGIAAILAGGDTIHSFFGIPLEVCGPECIGKMNQKKILALIHADTIIIDEVSMLRCDIVDCIDRTMRKVLRKPLPFGGKQVVFVGDMFQLPPIVAHAAEKELMKDLYNSDQFFFYKANAVVGMDLVKIEFKKIYRQDNKEFLDILENVRLNKVTTEDINKLNERVCHPVKDEMVITLASTNKVAERINQEQLNEIDAEEYLYEGEITGKFDKKYMPVDEILNLKVGAQVMFVRNDQQKRWVNGTLGKVEELTEGSIIIRTENDTVYMVEKCTWEAVTFDYDKETKKLRKEITGTFTQYPLKLAWGITIHKSQGMTFEKMQLDLSGRVFADGQLYVALSRVRSLEGLYLSRGINSRFVRTNSEIVEYASGYNNEKSINNEIERGKAAFELMKENDFDNAAKEYLILAVKKASDSDIREAEKLAGDFMKTVICDDEIYGCIKEVPKQLMDKDDVTSNYISALFCLYANEYEESLNRIEKVLAYKQTLDVLYIKSRSLAKLERYNEADSVNDIIGEEFEFSTPDLKILYMIAVINELYIGDPGIEILSRLVKESPNYKKAILTLRSLMKRKGEMLGSSEEDNAELINAFDSELSDEEFETMLDESIKNNKDAYQHLTKKIMKLGNNKE